MSVVDGHDVLIAGGGMVGATLALALAPSGLRIGLLEATPWNRPAQPSYDDRSIALAQGSRLLLEDLGLWSSLAERATPIHRIHVSERGRFGATRLDCREEGVDALGYVVENREFGRVLYDALSAAPVEVISPARVQAVEVAQGAVTLDFEHQGQRRSGRASLLVVAAGSDSSLLEMIGSQVTTTDYGQSALVANVTPQRPHRNQAYERFTESGPLALLPLSDARCALVLTLRGEHAARWQQLADQAFLEALQHRFGDRLGRFLKVGERSIYPLRLVQALPQHRGRTLLLGNAARTLHPVAGQGFNLALRDIAALADAVLGQAASGADPGEESLLAALVARRRRDQRITVGFTDALVRLFSNELRPLAHARAAGLVAVDLLPPLRHALARLSMGLNPPRPRLRRYLDGRHDG